MQNKQQKVMLNSSNSSEISGVGGGGGGGGGYNYNSNHPACGYMRSASTDCYNSSSNNNINLNLNTNANCNNNNSKFNDFLLNESEHVLDDLNRIIDSHSKYLQIDRLNKKFALVNDNCNLKKNDSFNKKNSTSHNHHNNQHHHHQANLVKASSTYINEKLNSDDTNSNNKQAILGSVCSTSSITLPTSSTPTTATTSSTAPISISSLTSSTNALNTKKEKFKSKSYLLSINRKCSDGSFSQDSDKNSTVCSANSPSSKKLANNTVMGCNPHATISGTKTKKLTNTNIVPNNFSAATCFINSAKKKRSSLFNLFSFKTTSSTSSTNSNSNLSSKCANSANNLSLTESKQSAASQSQVQQSPRTVLSSKDIIDCYDNVFIDSSHDINEPNDESDCLNEKKNDITTTPLPPVEFADWPESLNCEQSLQSSSNKFRPHSVAFPTGYSLNSDCWHKSRQQQQQQQQQQNNTSDYKQQNKESQIESNSNRFLRSGLSNTSFNDNESMSEDKSPSKKSSPSSSPSTKSTNITKKSSIRSKGFSIPLNASFCVNPVPINCLQHFSINNNSNSSSQTKFLNEFNKQQTNCYYSPMLLDATLNYGTNKASNVSSSLSLIPPSNDINQTNGSLNFLNEKLIKKSQLNSDINLMKNFDIDDDDLLFKPNISNLDEGSCLKELNQRLKFAEVKSIEDEFSDEALKRESSTQLYSLPDPSSISEINKYKLRKQHQLNNNDINELKYLYQLNNNNNYNNNQIVSNLKEYTSIETNTDNTSTTTTNNNSNLNNETTSNSNLSNNSFSGGNNINNNNNINKEDLTTGKSKDDYLLLMLLNRNKLKSNTPEFNNKPTTTSSSTNMFSGSQSSSSPSTSSSSASLSNRIFNSQRLDSNSTCSNTNSNQTNSSDSNSSKANNNSNINSNNLNTYQESPMKLMKNKPLETNNEIINPEAGISSTSTITTTPTNSTSSCNSTISTNANNTTNQQFTPTTTAQSSPLSPTNTFTNFNNNNNNNTSNKDLENSLNSNNNTQSSSVNEENNEFNNGSASNNNNNNSTDGSFNKKKRFQQFQARSLLNLNDKIKKPGNSSTNENQNDETSNLLSADADISKNPVITVNDSNINLLHSSTSNLQNIFLTFESTPFEKAHSEMVQLKKGVKLRDLLRPVMNNHNNLNIDDFVIYKSNHQSNDPNNHQNPIVTDDYLVDLNGDCDNYSGLELLIKPKIKQSTDENISTSSSSKKLANEQKPSNYEKSSSITSVTPTSTSNSTSTNSNFLIASFATNSTKIRKASLQIPSTTSENNENSTNLNTKLSVSTTIANNSSNSGSNNNNNNNNQTSSVIVSPVIVPSSNNWQNYFNSKINSSKEKLNNKQKRNSCIAVMNDFTNSATPNNTNMASNSANTATTTAITNSTVSTNGTSNITASVPIPVAINLSTRDSTGSFQSYLPSSGISPSSSPTERPHRPTNKNFKKMAYLSSILVNYNSNKNKDQSKVHMERILESFLTELPKLPEQINVKSYDPTILEIETDWNKFVGESFSQSLPTKLAKQQMAIWELFTTECSHIKTTKVIIDVFLSCLFCLKCTEQTCDLFKEIDIRKLFCNIIDVFNCNINFWQTYLYPIIENLNSTNKIIDTSNLIAGFSDFMSLFAPYEEFILEKNNSVDYFKKKTEENENFNKFITWAENHPLVGRLKISDFMMIPVQRLTRYELLLKKIHQFTEADDKREQLSYIIDCVYSLPNSINIKLKYLAQFNDISESIEKYEGVVGPTDEINDILSTYKILDIKSPLPGCLPTAVRELIHQGPLKLKDSPKSLDVHCFLFTDLLLITQLKKTKKYKIIKPPVLTNRMVVKELAQTDKAFVVITLNDFNVPDSVSMFISNQSKKWIEFLELAKKNYLDEIEKAKSSQLKTLFNFNKSDSPKRSTTSNSNNHLKKTQSSPNNGSKLASSPIEIIKRNSIDTNETNTDDLVCITPQDQVIEIFGVYDEDAKNDDKSDDQTRRDSSATITQSDINLINDVKTNENESLDSKKRSSIDTINNEESLAENKVSNDGDMNKYSSLSSGNLKPKQLTVNSNEKVSNLNDLNKEIQNLITQKQQSGQSPTNEKSYSSIQSSFTSSSSLSSTSSTKLNPSVCQTISSNNNQQQLNGYRQSQYQQHNGRYNSRIIDRRIQRRNMTDPLSTASQSSSIMDEKHSILMNSIIKRNSLNDKSRQNEELNNSNGQGYSQSSSHSNQPINQRTNQHLVNLCGDSTSTIMSTDSGVSCENQNCYSDESISKSPKSNPYIDKFSGYVQTSKIPTINQNVELNNDINPEIKKSSLKTTNSVSSTTSSSSASSSSSSASTEPSISSSSFSSATSSSNIPKYKKQLAAFNHQSSNKQLKQNRTNQTGVPSSTLNDDNEIETNNSIIDDYYENISLQNNDNSLIAEDEYEYEEINEDADNCKKNLIISQEIDDGSTFSNVFKDNQTKRLVSIINNSNKIINPTANLIRYNSNSFNSSSTTDQIKSNNQKEMPNNKITNLIYSNFNKQTTNTSLNQNNQSNYQQLQQQQQYDFNNNETPAAADELNTQFNYDQVNKTSENLASGLNESTKIITSNNKSAENVISNETNQTQKDQPTSQEQLNNNNKQSGKSSSEQIKFPILHSQSQSQLKFQQPNFSLASNSVPSIQKQPLQQTQLKRQLVKINSTNVVNETIRVNPSELVIKSVDNNNNTGSNINCNNENIEFDPTIRSAHLIANPNSNSNSQNFNQRSSHQSNSLALDNHQRMILVKLLHTTMDATYV